MFIVRISIRTERGPSYLFTPSHVGTPAAILSGPWNRVSRNSTPISCWESLSCMPASRTLATKLGDGEVWSLKYIDYSPIFVIGISSKNSSKNNERYCPQSAKIGVREKYLGRPPNENQYCSGGRKNCTCYGRYCAKTCFRCRTNHHGDYVLPLPIRKHFHSSLRLHLCFCYQENNPLHLLYLLQYRYSWQDLDLHRFPMDICGPHHPALPSPIEPP